MVGGDFDIPVMYQDMANYTMNPMMPMMPIGGIASSGIYGNGNTSYLGGINIKPQLDNDKIEIMNKKEAESKDTAKKVAIGLGILLLIGFIPGLFGKKSGFAKLGEKFSTKYPKATQFFKEKWTNIQGFFSRKKAVKS